MEYRKGTKWCGTVHSFCTWAEQNNKISTVRFQVYFSVRGESQEEKKNYFI